MFSLSDQCFKQADDILIQCLTGGTCDLTMQTDHKIHCGQLCLHLSETFSDDPFDQIALRCPADKFFCDNNANTRPPQFVRAEMEFKMVPPSSTPKSKNG